MSPHTNIFVSCFMIYYTNQLRPAVRKGGRDFERVKNTLTNVKSHSISLHRGISYISWIRECTCVTVKCRINTTL